MNFNLIACYNPNFEYRLDHLKHIELAVNMFSPASKTCIIGDLNQDLLTSKGELLVSSLSDYNFQNFVDKPTHFQGNSSSLIDVCFLNDSCSMNSSMPLF